MIALPLRPGQDAAAALRALLPTLSEGEEIVLPPGEFALTSAVLIDTPSIAHDDGCGSIHEKEVHLHLRQLRHLTLRGSVDEKGRPATLLYSRHDDPIQGRLPAILWAENCPGLTLRDLAFTRRPETAWRGIVESTEGGCVRVRVESRETLPESAGAYCMNRFDLADERLVGESLTVGFGYDRRFRRVSAHEMILEDAALAEKIHPGEGLSWHQSGLTDFLLFFGACDDLALQNIRVLNTNAFALLTENCRNITARRLVLRPPAHQFFTGPRDGWKIYRCGGRILVEDSHFEGFRMDAQNVHSNYFRLEKETDGQYVFACKYAPVPLREGSALRLHLPGVEEKICPIAAWKFLPGRQEIIIQSGSASAAQAVVGQTNHITLYQLSLLPPKGESAVPPLPLGALAEPLCWEPESYTCRRTVFRNIAGAGHLLRCRHALLEDNVYEHLMNAGVLIGDEMDTHSESGHGRDILIRRCRFRDIGFKPRYGPHGCAAVAVCSQGFSSPVNEEITLEDNEFLDGPCALEVHTARRILLRGNRYRGIREICRIDEQTADPSTIRREKEEPCEKTDGSGT